MWSAASSTARTRYSSSISCAIPTAFGASTRCRAERIDRDMTIKSTGPFIALGIALVSAPLSSYAFIFYNAEAIEGWVADAETGKPIEGVIVVAHWRLEGGLEGGTPIDELKILETVTDRNGRYSFPAWGPQVAFSGFFGSLRSESPEILMFKKGYKFQRLINN